MFSGTGRQVYWWWWWWVVVICEFSVLLWSKPFTSSLSFGLRPSRTIESLDPRALVSSCHGLFLRLFKVQPQILQMHQIIQNKTFIKNPVDRNYENSFAQCNVTTKVIIFTPTHHSGKHNFAGPI